MIYLNFCSRGKEIKHSIRFMSSIVSPSMMNLLDINIFITLSFIIYNEVALKYSRKISIGRS
jgi:hypothetical protein